MTHSIRLGDSWKYFFLLLASLLAFGCETELEPKPLSVAVTGSDQTVLIDGDYVDVELDGTGSYVVGMPEAKPSGRWSIVSDTSTADGGSGASIENPDALKTQMRISSPGLHVVRLDVSYDDRDGTPAYLNIQARPLIEPPVADAGPDQTVTPGDLVELDGTASYAPGGGSLTFSWRQALGQAVDLQGDDTATPSFQAPEQAGELGFSLVVTDERGLESAPAQTVVTVEELPPVSVTIVSGPGTVYANEPFSIVAEIHNAAGGIVASYDEEVLVAIKTGPAEGALSGTLSVHPVEGVAVFNDLALDHRGDYTLEVSSSSLESDTRDVTVEEPPLPPTHLYVTGQPPAEVGAGVVFDVIVVARDSQDEIATTFDGEVSLVVHSGPGELIGDTTVNASGGEARFSNLRLTVVGGYILEARADSLNSGFTTEFAVVPGPASTLDIVSQPTDEIQVNRPFTIVAEVQDDYGHLVVDYASEISIALHQPGQTEASLGGNTEKVPESGIVTFDDLYLDAPGTYRLRLSGDGLADAHTDDIDVSELAATQLVVDTYPTDSVVAGEEFTIVVHAHNEDDELHTGFSGEVTLSVLDGPDGGALLGTTAVNADDGVALFENLRLEVSGEYELEATSSGLDSDTVAIEVIPGGPAVLVVSMTPEGNPIAGSQFNVALEVFDDHGNAVTDAEGQASIAIQTGLGVLEGDTQAEVTDGEGTFEDLWICEAGEDYSLRVSFDGIEEDTSSFDVLVGDLSGNTTTITADPDRIIANGISTSDIVVTAKDGCGNRLWEGGSEVDLETTAGTLSDVLDNDDGTYTAILTSSLGDSEIAEISGTIDSFPIETTVEFVASGGPLQEARPSSGYQAEATFPTQPIQGNLLVAVSVHRMDWTEPFIDGDDWNHVETVLGNMQDNNQRIAMAIWYKIAGDNEPRTVQTHWELDGGGGNTSRHNTLIVQEYAGTYSFDTHGSETSHDSQESSLTIETQEPASASDSLIVGALGMREDTNEAVWSNGLVSRIRYVSDDVSRFTTAQLASRTANTAQQWESTADWSQDTYAVGALLVFSRVPDALGIVSGDGQAGTVGEPLDDELVVRIVDSVGLPVYDQEVTFEIEGPNGASGQLEPSTVNTNEHGEASTSVTLGGTVGTYTIRASASGELDPDQVTFSVDAHPGPPDADQTTITATPREILADGISTSTIIVELKDSFGNPVHPNDEIVCLETDAGTLDGDQGDCEPGQVQAEYVGGAYGADLVSSTPFGATAEVSGTIDGEQDILDSATVVFRLAGEPVQQTTNTETGNIATATFDTQPTEGNLLVAVSAHRMDCSVPNLFGDDWELVIEHHDTGGHQKGLAVWYKIAGPDEPVEIQAQWTHPDDSTNEDRSNALVVQEYFGTFEWDVENVETTGGSTESILSTGFTDPSAGGDSLVVGALGMRGEAAEASWTRGLTADIHHISANTPTDSWDITVQVASRVAFGSEEWESTASDWGGDRAAIAAIVVFSFLGTPTFAGGEGTIEDPYRISDAFELQRISRDLEAHYLLVDDIEAGETIDWNGGLGFMPIGDDDNPFTGTFDGDGNFIFDLYMNRPDQNDVGLFGLIEEEGTVVTNVCLENVYIVGEEQVGAIAGRTYYDTVVEYVCSTGYIEATNRRAGGLIGYSRYDTFVRHSYSRATIIADSEYAGGLVSYSRDDSIIEGCYSTGFVSDVDRSGGLVGRERGGAESRNSYWDIDTSDQTDSAGDEEGKTTSEMTNESTFVGWDFTDIWGMDPGINDGYPYLRVFHR